MENQIPGTQIPENILNALNLEIDEQRYTTLIAVRDEITWILDEVFSFSISVDNETETALRKKLEEIIAKIEELKALRDTQRRTHHSVIQAHDK